MKLGKQLGMRSHGAHCVKKGDDPSALTVTVRGCGYVFRSLTVTVRVCGYIELLNAVVVIITPFNSYSILTTL